MDQVRETRYWAKVNKSAPNGCWPWTAATNGIGYGLFKTGPRNNYAHRISWELAHGPIPTGLDVCHTCDNPPCVRPDHLFLGTRRVNMQDAKNKGRLRNGITVGSNNPSSKLTEAQVGEIRRRYANQEGGQVRLSREYGVSKNTIASIVHGERWRYTGEPIERLPPLPIPARSPVCQRGHPMKTSKSGRQICLVCQRLRGQQYRQRKTHGTTNAGSAHHD